MSSERRVQWVWTCDACGHTEVTTNENGLPPDSHGWRQVVMGTLTAQLGNIASRHLCPTCAVTVNNSLEERAR